MVAIVKHGGGGGMFWDELDLIVKEKQVRYTFGNFSKIGSWTVIKAKGGHRSYPGWFNVFWFILLVYFISLDIFSINVQHGKERKC